MRLLNEHLLELADAASDWPTESRPSLTTLRRWGRDGVRGVKLETAKVGWRVFTSREAVSRFLSRLNGESGDAETVTFPRKES